MRFGPAISAPLPWLTAFAGRFLAKKDAPTRGKWPRSLKTTRAGKWYIAILFLIGFAAINTGNNLLYLILATLLSLIVTSGIISESTLRGITVERVLPPVIFKNTPIRAGFRVTNSKRLLPSFSFTLQEADVPGLVAKPLYVFKLKAREAATFHVEHVFAKRGHVAFKSTKIHTRFPFGLFTKGRDEYMEDTALVFPDVRPKRPLMHGVHAEPAGNVISRARGMGAELRALRDYTSMDDSRFIHWRSMARTGKLMFKELESEARKRAVIVFDNFDCGDAVAFEELVDEAASEAWSYMQSGYCVGLKTLGDELSAATGDAHIRGILKALALIEPAKTKGAPTVKVLFL